MFFRPQFLVGNQVVGNGLYFGLSLGDIIYYTTPGADTFDYPDYPGLRAVIVECQGGGGGGGGAVTTGAGEISGGGGGGGGAYARSFVLASDLATSEAVTVGAGGSASAGSAGSAGGTSTFDTISTEVSATGGAGGSLGSAQTVFFSVFGGVGAENGTGDLIITGSGGERAIYDNFGTPRGAGNGGGSHLGGGARANSGNTNGSTGKNYGGGGSGAINGQNQGSNRSGGAGAPGIVIVSLFY